LLPGEELKASVIAEQKLSAVGGGNDFVGPCRKRQGQDQQGHKRNKARARHERSLSTGKQAGETKRWLLSAIAPHK
jgi:hypothetical protein